MLISTVATLQINKSNSNFLTNSVKEISHSDWTKPTKKKKKSSLNPDKETSMLMTLLRFSVKCRKIS